MEEKKRMMIPYSSTIYGIQEVDNRFDRGILRIAYHGKNRNMSRIGKDAFERAAKTAVNCPIVCRYDRDEDELGGHDVELVEKDGGYRLVNSTTPVGVVPESAGFWWETFVDSHGAHEYFCTDVLIWKRQEAYEKIRENGITEESMEINVLNGSSAPDGYYDIFDFEFTAFCLLGNVEPCFEGAALELFSISDMQESYSRMLEDMKESAEQIQHSFSFHIDDNVTGADIHKDAIPEGVREDLDQKKEMMAKFGLTEDDLDFSIEDAEIEGLEEKLKVAKDKKDAESFALTAEQFREEIMAELCTQVVMTEWGEDQKWWYIDYDMDAMEVYCYDVMSWNIYGIPYTVNGDSIALDYGCAKRKKVKYEDFEDGEAVEYGSVIFDVIHRASKYAEESQMKRDEETWSAKYDAKIAEYDAAAKELNELRQYKLSIEAEERRVAIDETFGKFECLNGIEAFEALKTDCSDMSIEDIEEKCFAIKGRSMTFSAAQPSTVRIPVSAHVQTDKTPYGGLVEKYNH